MVFEGDPHGTLGLAPGASQAEIKAAYRRLAKAFHPDTAGDAAIPRFLAIQAAYEAHAIALPAPAKPLAVPLTRGGRTTRGATRELRERGYSGAYTAVKRFVAAIRPSDGPKPFEVRFETAPGHQAQVDFARFVVSFENEPGITRIVWLFALVLGHSRHIVARFGLHQDLQTLLRCHMSAFEAIGGVPIEILYDRMKTAVLGEVVTDAAAQLLAANVTFERLAPIEASLAERFLELTAR